MLNEIHDQTTLAFETVGQAQLRTGLAHVELQALMLRTGLAQVELRAQMLREAQAVYPEALRQAQGVLLRQEATSNP